MKFNIIYISYFVFFATSIFAQNTKKSYIDIIDYWKIEKFNKKVNEVSTEHTVYDTSLDRNNASNKIKNYSKSKQIFNKLGYLVSQIDQKSFYTLGSKSQKNTQINYEYDSKHNLIKEKIYTNFDTITLKPNDTIDYSLKVYYYNSNEILKELLEYDKSKLLIKKTTFIIDTLKLTLEIVEYNLKNNNEFQFKKIYQFDKNSVLIEQTFFQFGKKSGINTFTYDEKGRKSKIAFSSATSMFESLDAFVYDNKGFLIELRKGSNLEPGIKEFYNYTFDSNKNWITKEFKNDDGIVVELFQRKISYFK